ncbi:DUF3376 domain-containing protein [Mycobacterium lentiflavum]|uniref:DUF3376 domain-containing protein n=1 Tax=Mycobacterium lentiflavum TaxID=141349 RepID=A0ABY3UW03_MYCLN|nr:DUF3376 domain-containing protein [Mycobacterium lentiflavum]ULP41578.1 DUF3376 domain-containing protein [Mycobacterium lentiflavum]
MTAQQPAARSHKQIRYAVVLNGGVSLAVWMGGVIHELNRIRLASMQAPDSELAGDVDPWRAILEAAKRTAVVDLVAGTSAGGLNGTVLAAAVAKGADMPLMRTVWTQTAALSVSRLVRQHPQGAHSVLDGDYLKSQVKELLAQMQDNSDRAQDCTLLITATALDSTVVQTPLESGAAMSQRDGRRVCKFDRKLPPDGRSPASGSTIRGAVSGHNHFDFTANNQNLDALTLAARASASFPVAFAPVYETAELKSRRVVPKDTRVGPSWLVDGGVLDNAPIEPLLDVLRERPIGEPHDRVMLYITPGVGQPAGAASSATGTPTIKQTLASVLSAIREPDARLDLDALHLIFEEMSLTRTQAHEMISSFLASPNTQDLSNLKQAVELMFERYRRARAEAFERYLYAVSGETQTSKLQPPPEPSLDPNVVPGMPNEAFPPLSEGSWHWGAAGADRCLRWYGQALSRLHAGADESLAAGIEQAMPIVAAALDEVVALGKVIRAAVAGQKASVMSSSVQLRNLRGVYSTGSPALEKIYGSDCGSLSVRLGTIMQGAVDAIHDAVVNVSASDLLDLVVSVEVLSGWRDWGGADYDVPELRFHNVTPAAAPASRIPLENLPSQSDWPIKKLYGQRLGHFGAFASERGRHHDWLWGRLDVASELSRQLLATAGVDTAEAQRLIGDLIDGILADEDTDPDAVAKGAIEAYEVENAQLVNDFRREPKSLAKLEDTLWALSHQWGKPGFWLRVVLQPDWTISQADHILPTSDRRSPKLKRTARFVRWATGIGLRVFGRKLPSELRYHARRRRAQTSRHDAPPRDRSGTKSRGPDETEAEVGSPDETRDVGT